MKKIFSFTKKKKFPSSTPDNGSVVSVGYELKEKDLGKVHKAASVGDVAKLKQLAKKNDINQLDKENRTALHIACASGHVEVVHFLVESKAKLNLCDNQNRSALMKAVQGQHERCVNVLLENHAEPNLVDINGNTALHLTANIPSISTAMLLLEHEADINSQNKEGFTPLTVAVRENHVEMAEFLLKEGADVNVKDQGKRSPLMIAAGSGQIGMVRLLLQFDADITLKDTNGWSSDDHAVINGHHACSHLIIEHGTKRNAMPSPSHQVPGKKKKKTLLGSPSLDVEAGFSLGGPATDKDDAEDNSQTESLSRASKSAAADWPSSEDDDESELIPKKPQRVNLRKLIASKKGDDADNEAELGGNEPSEQPSSSKARSGSPERSPEPEDSEEEDDEDEDDDDDDEDEDEESEEEDEESEEEDEGEDEEEQECEEEEEDDDAMASVPAKTIGIEAIQTPSGTDDLKIIDSGNAQNEPESDNKVTGSSLVGIAENVHAPEKATTPETENNEVSSARTSNYGMPVKLDVEDDCVVSAIRVESKFSDEDESTRSLDKNIKCGSTAGPVTPRQSTGTNSPNKVGKEKEMDDDDLGSDSWSDQPHSCDTMWNDSDDNDEGNQKGGFGRNTVLAKLSNMVPEDEGEENSDNSFDGKDDYDNGSTKEMNKVEKRRSSWGSSLEDSDSDNCGSPREDDIVNKDTPDQKGDAQVSDLLPEATALPSKSTFPAVSPEPEGKKTNGHGVESIAQSPEMEVDHQKDDDDSSWDDDEVEDDELEKPLFAIQQKAESSPHKYTPTAVYPVQKTKDVDYGEVLKCSSSTPRNLSSTLSKPESAMDKELDEETDEVDLYEPQKVDEEGHEKDDEVIPVSMIDGDDESADDNSQEKNMVDTKEDPINEEKIAGSDSHKQKLQYDFANGIIKVSDGGDLSDNALVGCLCQDDKSDDEYEPMLTAYVTLCDKDVIVPQTIMSVDGLDEEPIKQVKLFSTPSKDDVAAGQHYESDSDEFSDEELPQTAIDDVDLDSPVELESVGKGSPEVRHIEELVNQKEDSTPEDDDDDKGEEDEDDDDEEEEEEEGDHSDENDQNEDDDEESPVGATFVPEREVSKDKQRDFLSELGLEKGEEEQDSWDSESHSENHNKTHNGDRSSRVKDQEEMSIIQEENKEVVRNNDSDGKDVDNNGVAQQKETEKGKWEPLSVLSKLEGETEKKTDLMEELGLGDVDDLEDASDWDSASTTSRRTLPGRRMPSPGVEELPECSTPSDQEQEQEIPVAAHPTAQKSVSLDKRMSTLPSPPALTSHSAPQPLPHPQPRARKMVPQKPESEEESDWDSDNVTSSSSPVKIDNQLANIAEQRTVLRPSFSVHEPSAMAWDRESNLEPEQQQQKEKDDALHTSELDLNKPHHSDLVASESGEKDDELSAQQSPKGGDEAGEDIPWKKSYEKLWVEVEKREVKKTYRNVTEELKEKFGELIQSNRSTAEDDTEEEQAQAESPSVKEASSNEEEGQPIVRPTARARTTVLLTIPEQRESGLEDSVTDSAENSEYEDRTQTCEPPDNEGSKAQDLELLNNSVLEEHRSPSPQFSPVSYSTTKDCSVSVATKTFSHGNVEAMSSHDLMRRQPDEAQPEPIQQLQLELSLGYNTAVPDKAAVNCANSEEDPEEFAQSQPPSLSIHSAATPGVSDEELEEDMQRFKHEVGMLKVVFLHLEKEKTQLQREVGKERTETTMEVQRSTASWDAGGPQEEVEVEKPETSLGHRKELSSRHGATQRDQQLTATDSITQKLGSRSPKSTSRGLVQLHLPLQQHYNNNKREGQAVAVEGTSQLELVRGARHSRAPQTNTHVNGDPLSVFDDSTLSEVSDDEGRSPSAAQRRDEIQNPGEMEMGEDFDELTQSSDTATDDIDSPTSGYRHASLLIQKLDSASLDSRSMVKVQSIFHEYERTIQKARSRHGHLSDKVSQLEMERAELKNSMEEIKDVKSALERHQLELQTEVNNLKFQLKQEQENRRNATMMYNTTKEKLKRTEEQQQLGVEQRQRVELTLRNLELEMRTLVNNMKQLEEDHSETQRLLAQERSARTLQENLFNSHLRKQQEIEEENRRNVSKSSEALSQLTEASDREKELIQQTATLQEELSILRIELEHSRANSSLAEESEALKECLEDTRRDLKLNKEALTQTTFQYNSQLATLKSELAVTTTHLEHERQTREMLEAEVESTRNRLAGALQEAERCQAARADTEKALLREKEEHQHIKDKHAGEAAKQREAVSSLSQKLTKAEAHVNSMENEVHRATLQLTEKALLLEALQREKDQAAARVKELETTLQAEKELANRAGARQEATQERLVQAQSEGMLLRQQLEEAQNKGVAKEHAVTDAQERFSDILSKLRSDCEERVQLVEERSKELASKAADLRDQVYKLEEEKNEREAGLRQLQQELADSLKKLSMSEASLEVNTRYRNDLEEEKARLLKDIDRLKGKLEESEDQYVQSERRINSLKSSVDEKERELTVAAQKLQEALSASAGSDTTIKQLEEAMQRLEIENARLEAAAKQQSNKIDALQKGAQEAAMVRNRLEDLVTNLQGSKMNLEDQLSREVQKQSMLCHTAQDSQALWEEELKSRSKLGLRLAELEKEKGELNTQMEIERKKAKKISEQKKAMDTRLDQEMKRNTELQKEMYRLRALVKTAKKKLQDTGGAEFGSPMSSLRMEMGRPSQAEGAIGRMKEKVDDLQVQLEKEASRCSQLEKVNGELKEQLASQKSLSRSNERLERSKRQLEDEVSGLRRQMEAGLMDQSQAEQYRRNAEERARQEIRQKLEEVNLFLQTQAASQEALDQIKSANEANLRSQLEQRIRELEGELGRARTTQQDSLNQRDSTRTELEQYHKLYTEELRLRKSLAAKLERANNRLSEANAKLLNEHHRKSFLTSSMVNGSLVGPSLDVGSLGSPGTYGATLGPLNRSLGIGLPLLSPMTEGQNSRVEDYLAKMQSELDRNISKELVHATAELEGSARMSPVGSASGVDLDPVSRATQQYLEVLKKNYMI